MKTVLKTNITLIITAILTGIIVSIVAQLFIISAKNIFFFLYANPYEIYLFELKVNLLPLIACTIAASLISIIMKFTKIERWHGPADSIYAANQKGGILNIKISLLSTIVSFFSISGGASVGIMDFGCTGDKIGAHIIGRAHQDYSGSNYSTNLEFWTANPSSTTRTKKVEIGADGNLDIIDGNLTVASGHGIDFSAAAAGAGSTMTSKVLNDYEEGIFTPTFKFGGGNTNMSLGSMAGIYTKIGRMVYITVRYYMAGKGDSTGDLTLETLPFAVGDVLGTTAVQGGWDLGWSSGMASGIHEIKAYPWEGTSYLKFAKRANQDSAPAYMTHSDIVSTFDGRISFFYTT